jgi:hypothetical protein
MPKIKDISDRLNKDSGEYSALSFLIAERAFLLVTTLYFLTLLATVGGFYLSWLSTTVISMISYHLYSLMIVTMVWFAFAWSEHVVYIHAPHQRWISFVVL